MKWIVSLAFLFTTLTCWSVEELVTSAKFADGESIPYLLTTNTSKPKLAFIIMPGGSGDMHLRLDSSGTVSFEFGGNFLIRSRNLFASNDAIVISTDSSGDPDRMLGIVDDVHHRYGNIPIYIVGTSRSTLATMRLANKLDSKVAGFVHTSSMSQIDWFDTRELKSRQLIVHHIDDGCRLTPYRSAKSSSVSYGTQLITMEGGQASGDPCQAFGYHGYNGIEAETVTQIRNWAYQKWSKSCFWLPLKPNRQTLTESGILSRQQ